LLLLLNKEDDVVDMVLLLLFLLFMTMRKCAEEKGLASTRVSFSEKINPKWQFFQRAF